MAEEDGEPSGQRSGRSDAVEAALADALERASKAGEWPLVAQLAGELEARRAARTADNVVPITRRRGRR